ncbi:MAG: diacylglycerol kinase family lipid kinase [Lachnospiraceae bacterium]|nr:diacylglycerol kinase family lipid kinase [Lachnospiraceae bacterium]
MYYFIVNPNAHSGHGEKIWRKLERQIENSGIEYEVYLTDAQGDARQLAEKLTGPGNGSCDQPMIIVAVGGDGTINEILDGLSFDRQVTLGYIPAGSGNDLARSLKLPNNPRRCLKRILNPRYYLSLDYGILSYEKGEPVHRRFMVSSGIGLDAAVCHNLLDLSRRHQGWPGICGRFAYIFLGIKQLALAKPVKGFLLLDGIKKVEFNHIYFVSSHIHGYEGGGFKLIPKADYSDGLLDLCVIHNSSKLRVFPVLMDALCGRIGHARGVRFYQCREVTIHVERPMPVHVDGESCLSQTDIHLRCVEKKLRMIV